MGYFKNSLSYGQAKSYHYEGCKCADCMAEQKPQLQTQRIIFDRNDSSDKEGLLIVEGSQFIIDGMTYKFAHWRMSQESARVIMTNRILDTIEVGYKDGELYHFHQFGVERKHKNPMVAFAQLLWNINI